MTFLRSWWAIPLGLVALGSVIVFIGFTYDVIYAGIPYQHPTPAMSAEYVRNQRIAAEIRWVGLLTAVAGFAGAGVARCWVVARRWCTAQFL